MALLAMAAAVPTWAAEDFAGTKEVRLIQGDLGSPKAKTVVITDKAKIDKLLGTIKLTKKEPCACDHINHVVFVKDKGQVTVSLCDHCFDVGKNTYVMPPEFYKLYMALVQEASAATPDRTYRNPVIDENLADPAVIRHDGTYYLYATGAVDGDNGYRVYTSADLVNWKRGPVVFRPGQRHVWAPDVWRDPASGRFYMYYTASMTVGVADAEGLLGLFAVRKKLFDNAIDAHLFRDDDGRLYLYFVQLPGFRIAVQPMASPTEPAGEPRVVLQPESAWETRNGHVTEGPWMIKHDGRYYLLYSGSGADTPDYAVGYATSTSPLGPFTRAEHNPILHRADGLFGPGHGCAIRDGDGQLWFVYHQKRTARREWDRFICIDPLRFDEQGRLHGCATRGEMLPRPATARSSATSP
jgi:xylan 1,4-beta-xylosidase